MQQDKNQSISLGGFSKVKSLILIAAIVIAVVIIVFIVLSGNSNKAVQDQNSNIKGNLAIVLTNSMLYLDRNSNYKDFCQNEYFTGPSSNVLNEGGSAICNVKSDNSAWCACTTLKVTSTDPEGSTFCVDNRGYKRVSQSGCDARCTNSGVCTD